MQVTLSNLHEATTQQVFDHIANHLLTQNKKSINQKTGKCAYRYIDTTCAAGCLMTADEYMEEFEGKSWLELSENGHVCSDHDGLISDLQYLHDYYRVTKWPSRLADFATDYNLKFNFTEQKQCK